MNDELRLGFHRLGERLEDPVNLGVAVAFLWLICSWLVGIAFAMSFVEVLLLIAVGVAAVVLLRGQIREASTRMRDRHQRLERRRPGAAA